MKRSYQKIQEDEEDEDDDYRNYNSPRNTGSSATQLVGNWPLNPPFTLNFISYLSHHSFPPLFGPKCISAVRTDVASHNHIHLVIYLSFTLHCFQTEELVKALQDLENAASGDAAVRQKIASLPQEVQDVSLLEKITGESGLKGNICPSISVSICIWMDLDTQT